jgi:hypothetical protein
LPPFAINETLVGWSDGPLLGAAKMVGAERGLTLGATERLGCEDGPPLGEVENISSTILSY